MSLFLYLCFYQICDALHTPLDIVLLVFKYVSGILIFHLVCKQKWCFKKHSKLNVELGYNIQNLKARAGWTTET